MVKEIVPIYEAEAGQTKDELLLQPSLRKLTMASRSHSLKQCRSATIWTEARAMIVVLVVIRTLLEVRKSVQKRTTRKQVRL